MFNTLKAVSLALQSFPVLNSSVDEKLENITYKVSEGNFYEKCAKTKLLSFRKCKGCKRHRKNWQIVFRINVESVNSTSYLFQEEPNI